MTKQKITTCLWFDGNAEEAAKHYTAIFKDSKIKSANPMTVAFELEGREFVGLNGGSQFKFNEAVSLVVHCNTQAEVDEYWGKLLAGGGQESQCGWLKDKFGLSWQMIPKQLMELMQDPDPKRSKRVVDAMLKMKKIDIAALQKAHAG